MKLESEQLDKLLPDYIKLQGKLEAVPKDHENPHFKSRYADLAAVTAASRAELLAHGFALSHQPAIDAEGRRILVTTLWHSSGQFLRGVSLIEPEKPTFQSVGSAMTYTRRYDAMALLGLVPDDDDGNAAGAAKPPRQERQPAANGAKQGNGAKPEVDWAAAVEKWGQQIDSIEDGGRALKALDAILKSFGGVPAHKDQLLLKLIHRVNALDSLSDGEKEETVKIIHSKMTKKALYGPMEELEAQAQEVFV